MKSREPKSAASERPLKVLLVPDYVQWVTGTIALGICRHNPSINGIVCSGQALSRHLESGGELPMEPDVIHLLTEWEGHRLQDRFLGRYPVVNSILHVESWDFVRPLLKADAIHVMAEQWRSYLLKQGTESAQILKMSVGVDAVKFSPGSAQQRNAARKSYGIPTDSYVVGFAGKASSDSSKRKGVDVFEAAVKKLSLQVTNLVVFLVGPGWDKLKSVLEGLGVVCVWVPYMPKHEELVKFYWCLNTYWVTSRIEGGPVPLLEAMACETLCMTTPVGVVPEIIKHGTNGLIVSFDNADGFVEETIAARQFPAKAAEMARQARLTILKDWQDSHTAKAAEPLYRAAIDRFRKEKAALVKIPSRRVSRNRIVRKLEATDNALWSAELLRMGANATSFQLVVKALRGAPLSPALWRLALKPQFEHYRWIVMSRVKNVFRPLAIMLGWKPKEKRQAVPLK